jgi:hypothetical protein
MADQLVINEVLGPLFTIKVMYYADAWDSSINPPFAVVVNEPIKQMFTLSVGLKSTTYEGPQGPQGIQGIQGIQGPAGVSGIDMITTAEAVGGHRAITAAGLHATPETLDLVIGVTTGAAASGAQVPYIAAGNIDESSWSWVSNSPVFVGMNGVLTQTEPVGALKRIGTAVTATRLAVDLQPTIYRG